MAVQNAGSVLLIFVADTAIIFGYNFLAPLRALEKRKTPKSRVLRFS